MRLLARLRGTFPLSGNLPILMAGQLLLLSLRQHFDGQLVAVAIVLVIALLLPRSRKTLACFAAGMASALSAQPQPAALSPSTSYVVQVQGAPERPRVGQVRLNLAVLGSVGSDGALTELTPEPQARCKAVDLPWRNASGLQAGDRALMRASFQPLALRDGPFGYEAMLVRHGFSHSCKVRWMSAALNRSPTIAAGFRKRVKEFVLGKLGNNEAAGLVLAMSIGARNLVADETEQAFKRTGLAHLLVASGYQVMLIFGVCLAAARLLVGSFLGLQGLSHVRLMAGGMGLSGAVTFVVIVGAEPSIIRALCAAVFTVVGMCIERGGHRFNGVLFSLLCMMLVWPGCFLEASVQLTFAALCGLFLAGSEGGLLLRYLRACTYACVATSVVSLAWFGTFSLWTFLLNPILAPVGSIVGCAGALLAMAASACGLDPSGFALDMVASALLLFRDLVMYLSEIEGMSLVLEGWQRFVFATGLAVLFSALVVMKLRAFQRSYSL